VVLLSHLGLPFDEKAAREIKGIDVILGAHTHQLLKKGEWRENTLITQTGKFGTHVGKLEIEYDTEKKKIHSLKETAVSLEEEPDRKTEEQLQLWQKRSADYLSEQIGTVDHDMVPDDFYDNELAIILAKALKDWCEGDIGMVNAGVIVGRIEKGPVTRGDFHRVCPHPINPCKVSLSGKEVLEILKRGLQKDFQAFELKGFGFRGKRIGKLIYSGLTYKTDKDGELTDVQINGSALQSHAVYRVATTDMFTFGRLLPQVKAASEKDYYLPEMLRDLLAWALQKHALEES
jgi:2',3'-cyclic-nucleotide 2'-phosphodiesterase (5'-nucleotidase family)